jgi:hypothetical protein
MKEQIATIQIGQRIDDFIDNFEFEVYQNNEVADQIEAIAQKTRQQT